MRLDAPAIRQLAAELTNFPLERRLRDIAVIRGLESTFTRNLLFDPNLRLAIVPPLSLLRQCEALRYETPNQYSRIHIADEIPATLTDPSNALAQPAAWTFGQIPSSSYLLA